MGDVNVGDRVRVDRPSVEGVVDYVSKYDDLMDIRLDDKSIYATRRVDVVTKLASPLKVGDIVQPHDYAFLPTGTMLASYLSDTHPGFVRRPNGDWYSIRQDRSFPPCDLSSERKILFLPES